MKLYYAPGACSIAGRISLHEMGVPAEFARVDLHNKTTEEGYDFTAFNPKGYVPVLVLDDGEMLTENIAILSHLADRFPELAPGGPLGRVRLIEMLAYISTEIHKGFLPFFHHDQASDADRAQSGAAISARLDYLADHLVELYLFGPRFTPADAYLFANLRWARAFGLRIPPTVQAYFERVAERPAVRRALEEEGLEVIRPVVVEPADVAENLSLNPVAG